MRVGVSAVAAGGTLAAVTAGLAGPGALAVQRTSSAVPGWRIVDTLQRPRFNDLIAVEATSTRDAWAGGCGATTQSHLHPVPEKPILVHFSRGAWHRASLPSRLSGCISFVEATSARNVWAFGSDVTPSFAVSDFALHLQGGRWLVKKRWGPAVTKSAGVSGAVVLGRSNVWVFLQSDIIVHFDGVGWHRVTPVPGLAPAELLSASKDSRGGIWVLTFNQSVARLRRTPSGYTWDVTSLPGLTGGDSPASIDAVTPGNAWVIGGGQRQVHGRTVFYPVLLHWQNGTWRRVSVHASYPLRNGVPDGHGGLWLTSDWDSTGIPPHPVHYTGGRLIQVRLARHGSRYVGVYTIAAIPGSASFWGVGALSGLGGLGQNSGLVLKDGR